MPFQLENHDHDDDNENVDDESDDYLLTVVLHYESD